MPIFISAQISSFIFFPAVLFFLLFFEDFARAYEGFASEHPVPVQCQSSCHKPENISRAQRDKLDNKECKECHSGPSQTEPVSPFDRLGSSNLFRKNIAHPPKPILVNRISKKNKPDPGESLHGMAYVQGGEFIMGSNERWDDEAPEHISSTSAFYIDLYEVTNEDYKVFVEETGREPPYHWIDGAILKGKEKHPVVYVSWFDANDYCHWAGKRLPTEREWEKAARGVKGSIYPWGNIWVLTKSNNPYKHSKGTEPIGSYPEGRSPYRLYDMSGNVWEWVDSYYLPHPGNPVLTGDYGKDKRVLKGGSWFDCLSYGCGLSAPTFNRSFFTPEVRNNSFGFRCAKSG